MDDLRTSGVIRVLRRRRGWRQRDLAERAGVSQSQVSLVERGHLESLRVRVVRAIGAALDVALPFDPCWPGADLAKLLDQDHAALVEVIVSELSGSGWEVLAEYSFNHYGERGVVDIVGWHAANRALLIVEVKTRIADIQGLSAPLAASVGWYPSSYPESADGPSRRSVASLS
ncbi:hypothetical protein BH18CHL1_BH18CHL1_04890 [soil metagenome]